MWNQGLSGLPWLHHNMVKGIKERVHVIREKSHDETGSQRPKTLDSYSMCCVELGRLICVVQMYVLAYRKAAC